MGEYAVRTDGVRVKIGTCEDMYYLRWDQLDQLAGTDGASLDPRKPAMWEHIRFRFPFPQEDGVAAGEFPDHNYGVAVWGIEPPEIDHHKVQFVAREGFNVMLPCPISAEGRAFAEANSLRVHKNGYSGDVRIVQQRVYDGHLVLVADCGGCGARYRYPTAESVQPVLDRIDKVAADYARDYPDRDELRAVWWRTIADRIRTGYALDVLALAVSS